MDIIHQAGEFSARGRKVAVAIGMFDGVHLGHQRVLRQTIETAHAHGAVSAAVTFDCHPNAVVAPQRTPALIYSLAHRLQVIGSLGIETLLLIHFDRAFSQQSGEQFVSSLVQGFGSLDSICVGSDFTFGHRRSGNVALLRKLGIGFGFGVEDVSPVSLDGEIVSSTRIRQLIAEGQTGAAGAMLGRPYAISGRVTRGQQLGRQLGFPTANLDVAGLVLPPGGVYAGRAHVTGQIHQAVANIGYRPTINSSSQSLLVEVHLLGFKGDLYEKELGFEIVEQLRPERKFESLNELKAQIAQDVAAAHRALN